MRWNGPRRPSRGLPPRESGVIPVTVHALAAVVVAGAACAAFTLAPAAAPARAALPVPSEICAQGWVCGWTGPD